MRPALSAWSCASRHSVRVVTADLVDAYTDAWGIGEIGPSGDDVLMTTPSSPEASIRGTNAITPLATPKTFTPNVQRQSLGVVSQTLADGGPTPALLQRTCTAPSALNAASARARIDVGSVTSVTTP